MNYRIAITQTARTPILSLLDFTEQKCVIRNKSDIRTKLRISIV